MAIVNKAFFHKMYTDGTVHDMQKYFFLSKLYVKCLLIMHHLTEYKKSCLLMT